jgi:cytochrome b
MQEIKVWDLLVRLLHWSLVVSVVGAWLTREGNELRHEQLGYAALAIVTVRFVWGFIGSRYARFGEFVRSPRETFGYLRAVVAHREPRHIGHNPLGGWMIVVLLTTIAVICWTGWLYTTETYWGVAWVGELHEGATDVLIALVALHVAGVVFTSIRQKENLVKAMITGTKRAPDQTVAAGSGERKEPAVGLRH